MSMYHTLHVVLGYAGLIKTKKQADLGVVGTRGRLTEHQGPPHNIGTGTGSRTLGETNCDSLIDSGATRQ